MELVILPMLVHVTVDSSVMEQPHASVSIYKRTSIGHHNSTFSDVFQLNLSSKNIIICSKYELQSCDRIGAITISVGLLLIISLFFFKARQQNWDVAKNNLQNQLFRSQVDPHFIFNAFSTSSYF